LHAQPDLFRHSKPNARLLFSRNIREALTRPRKNHSALPSARKGV
jgi:hypothetical protein